jgi:hypothetical protein
MLNFAPASDQAYMFDYIPLNLIRGGSFDNNIPPLNTESYLVTFATPQASDFVVANPKITPTLFDRIVILKSIQCYLHLIQVLHAKEKELRLH